MSRGVYEAPGFEGRTLEEMELTLRRYLNLRLPAITGKLA